MGSKTKILTATGAQQSWTVPSDLSGSTVTVELWGARGNPGSHFTEEDSITGGYVKGDVPGMAPGDILYFNVGQWGKSYQGGWPNGGNGPSTSGGGGGSTDVRLGGTGQAQQFMVAGGGGGGVRGGRGGAATGEGASNTGGGGGGTQTQGGSGGTGAGRTAGSAGSRNQGGDGGGSGDAWTSYEGAGGGGGYYGGGGGASDIPPAGNSEGGDGGGGSNWVGGCLVGGLAVAPTNTTSSRGVASPEGYYDGYVKITYHTAPAAPNITGPSTPDFDEALALTVTFDPDPDAVGEQSADLQWRVGTGAWTNVHAAGAVSSVTVPSGTFSPYTGQQVEIQVRTTDSNGKVGAWSDSSYFTPRTAPAAPTVAGIGAQITSPTTNITITPPAGTPGFEGYEVEVTADAAGAAGTVLADSSVNLGAQTASQDTQTPDYAYVNGTSYHLRTRIQHPLGVWSTWYDSGALVAEINAPLAPTLVLTTFPDTSSVEVAITNPGNDPNQPSYNQVYRTDMATGIEQLIGDGVALNSTFTDWTIGFNRSYRYRAVAVAPNGAATSSS